MDFWENKTFLHKNIKQFVLKAAASAIVTLNAEKAMAASCPDYIQGATLEGIVCDFNAFPSVTVVNDGQVGGINMLGYAPVSPSLIAINAGGTVNNNAGVGINVSISSLSNGISNSGTISSSDSSIVITNSSTVSGGIFNSGAMSSISGTGIQISNISTIAGGISNSGTIQVSDVSAGLAIIDDSIIQGDITNCKGGLIEADGGDGILVRTSIISGGISNNGVIRSALHTGISVINSSNVQGNISNNGVITTEGLYQGLTIRNGSTVSGSIFNNGTISSGLDGLSIYSATTVAGSISNQGTITGGQNGILVSFTATVNGGISNSGIIQGDINAINITSDSNVSNIDILGQSARVIGAVEAPNTTVNITNGTLFTSEGTYNVNAFNIGSNAFFNMANTITALTVNNSGTLAITSPLQMIEGDYVQQVGGLFQTDVSSTNNYGQLLVTGAVDLSQNGDIYVRLSQNDLLHNGDVLSDVISGNTLTTPADGFNVSDNSYIWTFIPTLNNASNGLNLTATINPEVFNVCQGTYCQGAATTILEQIAAGNPLFSPYVAVPSANALREAASQATPELTNENIQMVQLITRTVLDVAPMWDSLRGRSSGDAMLYPPGKIWVKPYGASITQNKRSTVQGFNATAYGAVIGKDIQLTNDWLFGGGFAAGGDNMHGKSILSGQSIASQAYQGMVYGAKKLPNHVYFAGQGLVGYELNDTNRFIPLYASTAKGSYNSMFTNIRAEAGWSTYALSPNFVLTPAVDVSYLYINQNSYREFGSPMDLLVASNHNSSLIVGAYTNGAYHLTNIHNQYHLTLTGYGGFAGDVSNNQPQVTSTFVAGGSRFSTFGVQFNGVVFRGGAGLALTNATSPLLIELNYDLQAGNNAYSGVGAATIKYKT